MSVTIQLRRDLAASWIANNPTLAQGEVGLEYDTGNLKVGNGVTPWAQLNYPGSPPNILKSMMPVRSSGIPAASAFVGSFVPPQPMTLPANCAGSFANAAVAATDAAVLNIIHQANGTTTQTVVGTITYAAGSAVGTFATTSGALVALNAGDTLYVQAPSTPDATLSDIAATLLIGQATVAISYVAGTDGTYAVFALGNSTTTTNLYNYAANSVALGTVLTSAGMSAGAAAGNSTAGVFALGNTTTTTNLYNYAANTCSLMGYLTAEVSYGAAVSNGNAGVTI